MSSSVNSTLPLICIQFFSVALALVPLVTVAQQPAKTFSLQPADSPVDNPLKGLVPYANPTAGRFPHSLEFSYLGLGKIVVGERRYDWKPVESILDDIASRGNQAVMRIYMEYPKKEDGIPAYLIQSGVKVEKWLNKNTAPLPPAPCLTPDYEDPLTQAMLCDFIAAFGEKYDGDPRLGYLTAGLLGTWGEWHTYPRSELFASKTTQTMVLDAYEKAFTKTPVLLRYPAGKEHVTLAENASRKFGYHDDSFAWATIDTGQHEDDWFFVTEMVNAGQAAMNKWQEHPIGGEIRPELWGSIFDPAKRPHRKSQDFDQCVDHTHVTWLMDSGLFQKQPSQDRRDKAIQSVRRMGYDLTVKQVQWQVQPDGSTEIRIDILNRGVAPFYGEWATELGMLDDNGKLTWSQKVDTLSVYGILPSVSATTLTAQLRNAPELGNQRLIMRVVNPLENGKPFCFGNQTQNLHRAGWLTLN
ncbi:MAG: hypothetical protein AAFN77_06715 [Planctomycetota bacterium]